MLNQGELSRQTIEQVAKAFLAGTQDGTFRKAIDLSTGLVGVNLQAPAKQLVPLDSPFQREIKRIVKPGANSDSWRTITALGSPMFFAAERAGAYKFATTLATLSAAFKVAGLGGEVTLEAQAASEGFDPALAKETINTLRNSKKLEGQAFLGACTTALGNPGAPTVADRAGVGTINGGGGTTYFVRIVALTLMAANRIGLDVPAGYDGTDAKLAGRASAAVNPAVDNSGAVITTGCGLSAISAEGNSGSLSSAGHALKITWSPVAGALAYVVFVGTTTGAANLKAEAVVTQCSVTLTSLAGTGIAGNHATIPGTDQSADPKSYDGIIPQLIAGASGAYVKNLAGTLTGTAAQGEILEVQDAFASLFQSGKLGKFRIVVSGVDMRTLTKLGVVSNAMQIFASPDASGRVAITAGAHLGNIVNATTGDVCPVDVEPWLPAGTMLILPTEVPYNDANMSDPFTWVGSYDWMRWDYYPTRNDGPIYPFEVRCNGVLEGQFTAGCAVIYNIFKS